MSPQRYAAVNQHDDDNLDSPLTPISPQQATPSSPPPSFRSRTSSPSSRRLLREDPLQADDDPADNALSSAFDDGEESDAENDGDDRQRLMRANPSQEHNSTPHSSEDTTIPIVERHATELPSFAPTRHIPGVTGPRLTTDGVFANLSAKPSPGETLDDKPPTYTEAAADSTPPYWETTILAPGMNSDDVYINGLPVGSVFSFIWNGMISMSFLFPGFLLTYLLHTTHAAKNGSLAGLGLTLVQYGFYMRGGSSNSNGGSGDPAGNPGQFTGAPPDPNSHSFDPNNPTGTDSGTGNAHPGNVGGVGGGFNSGDLMSYGLMIIGWFILIRAVGAFLRARREEQLVLQSPARGLNIPVVAEGEGDNAA